jgi:hypothetical protein
MAGNVRPGQFSLLWVGLVLFVLVDSDELWVKLDLIDLERKLATDGKILAISAFARRGYSGLVQVLILTTEAL